MNQKKKIYGSMRLVRNMKDVSESRFYQHDLLDQYVRREKCADDINCSGIVYRNSAFPAEIGMHKSST